MPGNEIELTGTPSQIEWAERIRLNVAQEFARVAKLFQNQAGIQTGQKQSDTRSIIAILEEKRVETLANPRAGYFYSRLAGTGRSGTPDDRENDPRYQAIKEPPRTKAHRGRRQVRLSPGTRD